MNAPRNSQEFEGCRLFQVQLPRKALRILKERYGNIGGLIRGLLAEELGEDWPADELYIHSKFGPLHDTKLLVVIPRRFATESSMAERTCLPAPQKEMKRKTKDILLESSPLKNPVYFRT